MDVRFINPFVQAIKRVFEPIVHTPLQMGKPALTVEQTASATAAEAETATATATAAEAAGIWLKTTEAKLCEP